MDILYFDRDIAVCIKPAGALSEGDAADSLPKMLSDELCARGEKDTAIFPVHRLDRETCGVMVYARTSDAAAALSEDIRNGKFKKQYLAAVHGAPTPSAGTLCDLLYFDRRRTKSFVVKRERAGVKRAVLDYKLLDSVTLEDGSALSLVSIQLKTGRTHQIRVQFSSRKLPIIGDRRYGAQKSELSGIALISHSLEFSHPSSGEPLRFAASVPNNYPWTLFDKRV